jgi:hypothetical protein
VHAELASTIERRFGNARCSIAGASVNVEIAADLGAIRARAAMEPIGRVAVQLASTDGFELALRWTDRTEPGARAPTFDDSFLVETNDVALAGAWLDRETRDALLGSRYIAGAPICERVTNQLLRDGTWEHDVRGDEVTARRSDAEPSANRVADMLAVTIVLANRPVRWARMFEPIARALGGEPAARSELGGRPIVRIRRGAADVQVQLLRRLGPGDPGRLRTVIHAHRHGSSGETLSLIADDLPRSAWPPPTAAGRGSLRIDPTARALLDAARPSSTIVRPHDVEITFDGAFADVTRLGPAIALAARWAVDAPDSGPYR